MRPRLSELPSGFRLSVSGVCEFDVHLEPWALSLRMRSAEMDRFGLFEGKRLIDALAERIGWNSYVDAFNESSSPCEETIRSAVRQELAGMVEAQRRRLVAMADPSAVAVQAAVFRGTGRSSKLAEGLDLYRYRWVVRDVLQYRAAAIALAWCDGDIAPDEYGCCPGVVADVATVAARTHHSTPTQLADTRPLEQLTAMSSWRALFSPTRETYRSLDRTLMNLAHRIPGHFICYLRRLMLERPLTNRVELTTLLVGLNHLHRIEGRDQNVPNRAVLRSSLVRTLHYATEDEIRRAMVRIGAHTRRNLVPERVSDIDFFVGMIADYPEVHRGRIGGLATKAIRWHRGMREEEAARAVAAVGDVEVRTARPPITPPKVEGVQFLETVGDIINEGIAMEHCIANRARAAVAGLAFLFHIEKNGEHASIELNSDGNVIQAAGPRNTHNQAAIWGRQVLDSWGRR